MDELRDQNHTRLPGDSNPVRDADSSPIAGEALASPPVGKDLRQESTMFPKSGTVRCTVVDVDMVGYSDVARMLEENTSAGTVGELNRQIQGFIANALSELVSPGHSRILASTGDGALLLFERANDAHIFGSLLQLAAKHYSEQRNVPSAKRRFRVGIATGEVNLSIGGEHGDQYAGIAIANAVRLQTSAAPTEILVDSSTFAELSSVSQQQYSSWEEVRGKRDEIFRVRRCKVKVDDATTRKAKASAENATGLPERIKREIRRRKPIIAIVLTLLTIAIAAYFYTVHQTNFDTKPPDSSEFDSPTLVGTWEIASGDRVAAEVTLLELHTDGSYKKTLSANVKNLNGFSNSYGGTHIGRWRSRGLIVYLSGDGNSPEYLQDLSKARKLN